MGDREESEESLEEWARKRDRRRASDRQITGRRRAEPLDPAARGRAAHLSPDAPRLLLELDEATGQWIPVGLAADAREAAAFLAG
ncbi:DUF6087 family protein [Streptomyces sp. NPDC002073]